MYICFFMRCNVHIFSICMRMLWLLALVCMGHTYVMVHQPSVHNIQYVQFTFSCV